jgi:hypothetical protein
MMMILSMLQEKPNDHSTRVRNRASGMMMMNDYVAGEAAQ